jgi:hypothetical protein
LRNHSTLVDSRHAALHLLPNVQVVVNVLDRTIVWQRLNQLNGVFFDKAHKKSSIAYETSSLNHLIGP